MEVPFFNFDFSLGMVVSGLAPVLLRSKMISDGCSSLASMRPLHGRRAVLY